VALFVVLFWHFSEGNMGGKKPNPRWPRSKARFALPCRGYTTSITCL